MYDKEKIAKILKDIERYFTDLNSFNFDESNIEATEKFYATSMVLFGILNRMIDLAEEIIVKNEWGMPQSYKEYFDVLANNNGD